MPLYFVEHRHTAETCPTQKPEMMAMLGQHVTQANADKYGIRILADVVHPGEHRMNMVLEAPNAEPVDEYMKPFGMVGTVEVKEVTTCEQVVASAKC
ncbi:MAG TPA: DUF3303 family protein [Dehalococcoidia bacterium]|jgi:uncharacterized protein with GYD domain